MLRLAGQIELDYRDALDLDKLLRNLSGIALAGEFLWTVSDEGRSFERLSRTAGGFALRRQYRLDSFFPDLPSGEGDLESLDVADGRIWLAGSNGRVRRKPDAAKPDTLKPELRNRPSRHLLGSIVLGEDSLPLEKQASALPFTGKGSLRALLGANEFIAPFLQLASKENGLDIEGLAVLANSILLGLRGPVIDSHAVIVALPRGKHLVDEAAAPSLHFLDLDGLGVRDLARDGDRILVLAGPTTGTDGPFRLHAWRPSTGEAVERPPVIYIWPDGTEHPEGITPASRGGGPGYLVVYDTPHEARIRGSAVTADWLADEG